ncbi:MAG TPA: ROK family protein [Flavitalea sp.]|nr:ROK family protein [Flavitalea sp.]
MFAGIEIGGSKLQIRIEDSDRKIISHFRTAIDPRHNAESIRNIIREQIIDFHKAHSLRAIGVGFGGPVNRVNGKIFQSFQVAGWQDFSFIDWFGEWISVPIYIENDANVAAIAEATLGAGKPYRKVFYCTLGSGVGSGFVNDGLLYEGIPVEMEFGHMKIDHSGTTVEQVCSGWAINKKIREQVILYPDCFLAELVRANPQHEAKNLKEAIQAGDTKAKQIFSDSMLTLAFAFSHMVHLLGPDVIVIGGGLSLMGEIVCEEVQKHLKGFLMTVFQPGPSVLLASLGVEVVPVGAIEYAKNKLKI